MESRVAVSELKDSIDELTQQVKRIADALDKVTAPKKRNSKWHTGCEPYIRVGKEINETVTVTSTAQDADPS